jgi:hypothetical protein
VKEKHDAKANKEKHIVVEVPAFLLERMHKLAIQEYFREEGVQK